MCEVKQEPEVQIPLSDWKEHLWDRGRMVAFLFRLLNPEDLGHAVTAEVRDEVRELLGMPRVEGGAK